MRIAAGVIALVLIVGAVVLLFGGGDTKKLSADFQRTVGVYEKSDVRMLGVKIGTITKIEPQGDKVRVEMEYDEKFKVPADAKAVVIPPSVVSDRYVQLTPVYEGGPELKDGAHLSLKRTAVPIEFDQIFGELNELNLALGPEGANKDGALTRLLEVSAANLDGNGQKLNDTLRGFSQMIRTLSENRESLFDVVSNLQVFTTALAQNDQQVRSFNLQLAGVAEQLDGEKEELGAALRNLSIALGEVARFVRTNKEALRTNISGLADVTQVLVRQQQALKEIVDNAPAALDNLNNAYNGASNTLDTRDNGPGQAEQDPLSFICGLLENAGETDICGELRELVPLPGAADVGARGAGGVGDPTLGGILRNER